MTKNMYPFRLALLCVATICFCAQSVSAQPDPAPVQVDQVREMPIERTLPLSGRIHSRNDVSMSLTLPGELEWVLEPGTRVVRGEIIAQLDQRPIALRRIELTHLAERERVNGEYLEKELARLQRLKKDSNASERQVDEGASQRDISRLVLSSLRSKIDQVDDEIRRSKLLAPFDGIIAERDKRGGEYAQLGEPIVRLVDLDTLELRFQVPVSYLSRIAEGNSVTISPHKAQLSSAENPAIESVVRSIITAANPNSQTFEVRADISSGSGSEVIAGQLVSVALPLSQSESALQIPRDAIVLRDNGSYVFRISDDNIAHQVMVKVGEGSHSWVSIVGQLQAGDWVATRGLERLKDGQQVRRSES